MKETLYLKSRSSLDVNKCGQNLCLVSGHIAGAHLPYSKSLFLSVHCLTLSCSRSLMRTPMGTGCPLLPMMAKAIFQTSVIQLHLHFFCTHRTSWDFCSVGNVPSTLLGPRLISLLTPFPHCSAHLPAAVMLFEVLYYFLLPSPQRNTTCPNQAPEQLCT